jgi:hypothetical protein
MDDTVGGGWQCFTSAANCLLAESVVAWLTRASRAACSFATCARRRPLGYGSRAALTRLRGFPRSLAACISDLSASSRTGESRRSDYIRPALTVLAPCQELSVRASLRRQTVLKFPFLAPRGAPGLNPPCKRHRLRPRIARRWHGVPARVLAPHFGARPSLVARQPASKKPIANGDSRTCGRTGGPLPRPAPRCP